MNTELLRDMLKSCKEYRDFTKAVLLPYGKGSFRPCLAQGLSDGAFLLFSLTLASDERFSRMLIICPEDKEASRLCASLSEHGVPSLFYPSRDFTMNNVTASHELQHERLSVLSHLLLSDSPAVICTTAEAALQAAIPKEVLFDHVSEIETGREIVLEDFEKKLSGAGYTRVNQVEAVGQFAVRGGIVDVFPPRETPVRIELFGDEVDRIGSFDIISQRVFEEDDNVLIPPVKEVILKSEAKKAVKDAVSKHLSKAKKNGKLQPHTEEILKKELSDLDNSSITDFTDKYISIIYENYFKNGEHSNLLSYFDGVICVRDTVNCSERLEVCRTLLEETVTALLETGELCPVGNGFAWLGEWDRIIEKAYSCPSFFADIFTRSYPDMKIGQIFDFPSQSKLPFSSDATALIEELRPYTEGNYMTAVFCDGEAEEKNLFKILFEAGFSPVYADVKNGTAPVYEKDGVGGIFPVKNKKATPVALINGVFPEGFEFSKGRFAIFDFSSVTAAKKRISQKLAKKKRPKNAKAIMSYHDLTEGDIVVHDNYGIGMYEGIENLTVDGVSRDYVHIRYAGTDKLFLPVDQLDMVSKYVGGSDDGAGVRLSKMGGADWNKSKTKAKKAAKDMAKELIDLYAKRRRSPGIAFEKDDSFSRQFADAFEYEETDSQMTAISDLTRDMERPYPMDRIVCGDVGYGKTEVAMRAAFKAVLSGYQVAILVPTTILAYQHYQTILSRFRGFPVSVDMLSRFRTPTQRAASVRKLKRGETDIIVGTHRLISSDIEFKNLGLIIIDEEQRFGVAQKEALKKLCTGADVLTLTATPIPRTLNMAMGGLLDMSVLDDVPGLRSPVQTYVMEHDDGVLAEAMKRELRRGGQVFYLHNRIDSIYAVADRISKTLPEARIAVGHGKLSREDIEDIWGALVKGDIDILISTTIIETGIDVPNANTLIIDNADRYGLSQLHQIRGRVGRSSRKAYAYFTYPKAKILSEVAEKRLRAIKEYAAFGAGFKIAMRDMEIRGAGNLLGAQQHGHLESVGYDLYLKLLNEAVLEETGNTPEPPCECAVTIPQDAFISKNYISDSGQRMEMYKKIARISNEEDFDDVIDEFCDRFGDIPSPTLTLCYISLIRAFGVFCRMKKIEQKGKELYIYPEKPDPFFLTEAIGEFPKNSVKLILTGTCALCFKIPAGKKAADYALQVMKALKSLTENRQNEETSLEESENVGK